MQPVSAFVRHDEYTDSLIHRLPLSHVAMCYDRGGPCSEKDRGIRISRVYPLRLTVWDPSPTSTCVE